MSTMSVYVDPEVRERLKQKLAEAFNKPTEQSRLMRTLLNLWLDDCIPLTDKDLDEHRATRGVPKGSKKNGHSKSA